MQSFRSIMVAIVALISSLAIVNAAATKAVTVWTWSLLDTAPQELAQITYDPNTLTSAISKYTPPTNIKDPKDIIRVGLYDPEAEPSWRGIAITAESFAEHLQQVLTLLVDHSGEIYHVGLSVQPPIKQKGKKAVPKQDVLVEISKPAPGPVPVLNRPVKLNPKGKVEGKDGEPEEKTFLQKYWWAFAAFLVLQMVMAGSKEKE